MKYRITVEGRVFEIEVTANGQVWVDNRPIEVDFEHVDGRSLYSLLVDHRSYQAHVQRGIKDEPHVAIEGRTYNSRVEGVQRPAAEETGHPRSSGTASIPAPLPGRLLELRVSDGDTLQAGDVVAVMESMKMHIELRAPQDGVVRLADSRVPREVAQGETLATVEPVKEGDKPSGEGANAPDS